MTRRVVLVGFDQVQSLDLVGPAEVFSIADRFASSPGGWYRLEYATVDGAPMRASNGMTIGADLDLSGDGDPMDTLIVAGGTGTRAAADDAELIEAIRRAAGRARRVASVCSGAFLLARAGLLDGRRATTHWANAAALARLHPEIRVEPDRIFCHDGAVWTSAGITAGIDLALELVAADHDRDLAAEVARWMVVYVQRSGGQNQFSSLAAAAPTESDRLRELLGWIEQNLDAELTVPAMAARTGMSVRTFQRSFRRELGVTPAAHVEAIRLDAARQALEHGDDPIAVVARRCGYVNVETMYRAFNRRLGVTPAAYRSRFRTASPIP